MLNPRLSWGSHPTPIALQVFKMPLDFIQLLMRAVVRIDRLKEPIVGHGNGQEEYVRDEVGRLLRRVLLRPSRSFFRGGFDTGFVIEWDSLGVGVEVWIDAVNLLRRARP